MPRTRTADDKLLALLARVPAPMHAGAIAEALGWSRANALLVASRLLNAKRLVRTDGERDGANGRPPFLFSLPAALPPAETPRLAPLVPQSYVVTPSNAEARVVRMCGRSHAEVEYVNGPERFQRAVIHIALLRPFQLGGARPGPVRI